MRAAAGEHIAAQGEASPFLAKHNVFAGFAPRINYAMFKCIGPVFLPG